MGSVNDLWPLAKSVAIFMGKLTSLLSSVLFVQPFVLFFPSDSFSVAFMVISNIYFLGPCHMRTGLLGY